MSIGERIKSLRKKEGLNQIEFCKKIKLSQGRLSEIEQGKNNPSYDTLISVKEVFGVSLDWLVTGEYSKTDNVDTLEDGKLQDNMIELSEEEIELVQTYRSLSDRQKGKLEGYLDGFIEKNKNVKKGLSSNYQSGEEAATREKKHA